MSAQSKILPLRPPVRQEGQPRNAPRTSCRRQYRRCAPLRPTAPTSRGSLPFLSAIAPPFLPFCEQEKSRCALRPPSSYVRPATIPTSDGVSQVARCGHGVLAARTDDDCAAKVLFRAVHGPHEIPSDSPTSSLCASQARAPSASPKPSTHRPCRRRRQSASRKRSPCSPRRIRCR